MTRKYELDHENSLTLVNMAGDCIERGMVSSEDVTGQIEEFINENIDIDHLKDKDSKLKITIEIISDEESKFVKKDKIYKPMLSAKIPSVKELTKVKEFKTIPVPKMSEIPVPTLPKLLPLPLKNIPIFSPIPHGSSKPIKRQDETMVGLLKKLLNRTEELYELNESRMSFKENMDVQNLLHEIKGYIKENDGKEG